MSKSHASDVTDAFEPAGHVVRITSRDSIDFYSAAISDPARAVIAVRTIYGVAGDVIEVMAPLSPGEVADIGLWPGEVRRRG